MVNTEGFDQFGQYSNLELQHKLYQLKFNNINNFIEASLNKTYNLYKKNKKSDITFMDYRTLMLKELERHKSKKDVINPVISRPEKSKIKIDISYFSLDDEESSICSI